MSTPRKNMLVLIAILVLFAGASAQAALVNDLVDVTNGGTTSGIIDDLTGGAATPTPTSVTWSHTVPTFNPDDFVSASLVIQADDVDLADIIDISWAGQGVVGTLDDMAGKDEGVRPNGYYGLVVGVDGDQSNYHSGVEHITITTLNIPKAWLVSGATISITAAINSDSNQAEIETSDLQIVTETVPEPATIMLLGMGTLALLKKKRA